MTREPLSEYPPYPIGTPGLAWGAAEKAQWLQQQRRQRDYAHEVLQPLQHMFDSSPLAECALLTSYGQLDYRSLGWTDYPLLAVTSRHWQSARPTLLVTGGVHGYERSGVHGALQFLQQHFVHYAVLSNVVVLPCISPWGYETINRWNPHAVDPNRAFTVLSPAPEAALAMRYIQSLATPLAHVDLHETTGSDNSEFRPAKAARDGCYEAPWAIPDGFYLVGDTGRPEPGFFRAMIDAVSRVTHIAPADASGGLIGEALAQAGVIYYDQKRLGLCGGMTDARFVATTEVYPDSPRSSPTLCNQAQVAALCAGFDFALRH